MQLRNCDIKEFKHRTMGKKIVCFGAGLWSTIITRYFPHYRLEERFNYIIDNNTALWGTMKKIGNASVPVFPPEKLYGEAAEQTVVLITGSMVSEMYDFLQKDSRLESVQCYCAIFLWAEETDRISLAAPGPVEGWKMNKSMVIPKKIHYTWFGDDPMPDLYKKCIDTWKIFCPEYEIIEWNMKNYDISKHPYMRDAFRCKKYSYVGDYARLDILYEQGGIYLDVDVELIRSLDTLLYNTAYFGFQDSCYVNLGHGFGAVKDFPLVRELRDAYDCISGINSDGTFNDEISPFYQTETFEKHGICKDGSFQVIQGAAIYPARYLSGKNGTTDRSIATGETYSLHHYVWSWGSVEDRATRDAMRRLYESAQENEMEANNI